MLFRDVIDEAAKDNNSGVVRGSYEEVSDDEFKDIITWYLQEFLGMDDDDTFIFLESWIKAVVAGTSNEVKEQREEIYKELEDMGMDWEFHDDLISLEEKEVFQSELVENLWDLKDEVERRLITLAHHGDEDFDPSGYEISHGDSYEDIMDRYRGLYSK